MKKLFSGPRGVKIESFSNWREDLIEVVGGNENDKIKEMPKSKKNKIEINPKISEVFSSINGTIIEQIEIDEMDFIIDNVYDELLSEGYDESDIEDAIEYALFEAKVTYGHDTSPKETEKKKEGLLSAARKRLSGVKKVAKQAVATGARKVAKGALGVARRMEKGDKTPSAAHTKTRTASTYRGIGVGQKEKVSSGSYTGPTKKVEPIEDPWKGSEVTSPKTKTKPKVTTKTTKVPKKKKKSNLDDLLSSIRNESKEEVQIDEIKITKIKKDPKVIDRAKSIQKIRDKKEVLSRLVHHAKLQKQGLADSYENKKELIDEKSVSVKQQQLMGIVRAIQKGEMKPSKATPEARKMASSMSSKEVRDFAKTKHKGLPTRVEENISSEMIDDKQNTVNNKNDEIQKKKIQMQKVKELTARLTAAKKGVY